MRARLPELLRFGRALTGSEHAAADLVQDALERTLLHWSRVESREDPEGYVRRIMVNRNISLWRKLRRERLRDEFPDSGYDSTPDDPDRATWRAVQGLPPRMRAVVALRYYEDLTEAQTARVLGCSVGTVKSQTSKAMAKLRAALDDQQEVTLMSRFDEDLRSTLRGGTPHVDVDAFLGDVHRGRAASPAAPGGGGRRGRRARGGRRRRAAAARLAHRTALPRSPATQTPQPSPSGTFSVFVSSSPSSSPSQSPAPSAPTAGATPTTSNGRRRPTGVRAYDIAGDGTVWRVTDEPCDTVMCSRVASYDGTGAWTTRADLAWPDPGNLTATYGGPATGVTVSPDGQDLWAYGGRLWSSHDGGRTWNRQELSFEHSGAAEVAVAAGDLRKFKGFTIFILYLSYLITDIQDLFRRPSYAAAFVIGGHVNGPTERKTEDGKTLKEIENSDEIQS